MGKIKAGILSPETSSNRQVIYLSGMLGTGKTTVASLVANRVGAAWIGEFTEPIPPWVYSTRPDDPLEAKVAAQMWTLDQHKAKDQLIKTLSGTVIVDRNWIDSLIYSVDFGEETVAKVAEEAKKYSWEPGTNLMLVVRPEVCKTRTMQRMGFTEEEWSSTWEPYVTRLYNTTVSMSQKAGINLIDTSDLTIEEVADLVQAQIH